MQQQYCNFCRSPLNPRKPVFKEPSFDRLAYTHTLESTRYKNSFHDCEAPTDLLERKLRSTYNHHRDWNKDNVHAATQPETCIKGHGRILLNRVLDARIPKPPPYKPFIHWQCPYKNHPLKNDNSITGVHLQETNGGYSRQPDGGFYKHNRRTRRPYHLSYIQKGISISKLKKGQRTELSYFKTEKKILINHLRKTFWSNSKVLKLNG
ncbi:hypothetical protein ECG_04184 [Echinococcus granulosus]|uniref:Expressed conserved protein n=1 Tax=Echinococcus granulosus TaxID=6210 RepID=A0A068WIM1_ECHGR|nr:hypothetical protein ECG_04184 [Echinococcus granulosus]CDS17538.1 hypothetical protein EgrG_001029500 [Echinococcus granulosus]